MPLRRSLMRPSPRPWRPLKKPEPDVLEDALKAREVEESIEAKDLSELVAEALDKGGSTA